MFNGFTGQILTSPDVALRRALRFGPGPIGFDTSLYIAGYVADEPQSTTLTSSHSRIQIINPAAARTILLPKDGIRKGEVFSIINRSAFDMTIQASDASAIDIIATGYIKFVALQDTPVDNGDWYVFDVYEQFNHVTTVNNLWVTPPALTIKLTRHNNTVTYFYYQTTNASKINTNDPVISDALPGRFRPSAGFRISVPIYNNGAYDAGWITIPTTGLCSWDIRTLTNWTITTFAGLRGTSGSYRL